MIESPSLLVNGRNRIVKSQSSTTVQLFYSYCHKDAKHRTSMETALDALRQDGLLRQWSDQEILPGQGISSEVRTKMEEADIIAFLFSPDFIASEECKKEWDYAQTLARRNKPLFRIPIIVRDCAWKDILKEDDVKALPIDGKPVVRYSQTDLAWTEVYDGIKSVVDELSTTFTPRTEFLTEIERTDFISQDHLKLQDLFVFLRLTTIDAKGVDPSQPANIVSNEDQLLSTGRALLFGHEKTGKTALARHLYLSLVQQRKPVLLLGLGFDNPPAQSRRAARRIPRSVSRGLFPVGRTGLQDLDPRQPQCQSKFS